MPRKCQCGKYASFNIPGEIPICCSKCKTVDMVDVIHNKCPCGKQPIYNMQGEKVGVCCKGCKTDGMIDVKNEKCPCGNRPNFNVPEQKKGVCCSKCKTDVMMDVVHNRCSCGTISPVFNILGKSIGICCQKCKTCDMVDVKNKRCSCGKRPFFNVPETSGGVCCAKCKTGGMIDVVSKLCPGYNRACPVRTRVSRGHMYCMSCDPNDARRKQYKRYEEAFFDYVKEKLDVHEREFHVSFEPVYTSKKFARLDGIVFGDNVIVCLEVDENGHEDYDCDEHRMHLVTAELLQKYPGQVVSWVRVNPTVGTNNQWSKTSTAIREKRFKDVVTTVGDILKTRDTRVVYIGFD